MAEKETDRLLTKQQVAERLNTTPRVVESLVRRSLLSCVKLGRKCVRFRAADVEGDLARLTVLSIGKKKDRRDPKPLI